MMRRGARRRQRPDGPMDAHFFSAAMACNRLVRAIAADKIWPPSGPSGRGGARPSCHVMEQVKKLKK